jgi:hypothetical protein
MTAIEQEYISSEQLATLVGYTKKWVEKHRHRIAGRQKIGGEWRYNLAIIRRRLATGKDIIE